MKLAMSGNQIVDLIKKAERTLILLSPQPTVDSVAAGAALDEVVNFLGKKADIICLGELPETANKLDKSSQIKKRLDPINLIISFNWAQSMIEKVSYSVEGEKFNLIITPSGKRLDPTAVDYSYRGSDYNLIISLGIENPEVLPSNMIDKNIFNNIATVNIDISRENSNYGKINVVDTEADSLSGLISELLKEANNPFSARIADYLLFGLRAATNNFEAVKNPATFESAAFLTKVKKEASSGTQKESEVQDDWFSPKVMRSSKIS